MDRRKWMPLKHPMSRLSEEIYSLDLTLVMNQNFMLSMVGGQNHGHSEPILQSGKLSTMLSLQSLHQSELLGQILRSKQSKWIGSNHFSKTRRPAKLSAL